MSLCLGSARSKQEAFIQAYDRVSSPPMPAILLRLHLELRSPQRVSQQHLVMGRTAEVQAAAVLPKISANAFSYSAVKAMYWSIESAWSWRGGCMVQVSFVNSICTVKGGTHVAYVADQLTK